MYSEGYKIIILSARSKFCSDYIKTFMEENTSVKKYQFIGLDCGKAQSKVDFIDRIATNGSYFVEDSIYNLAYASMRLNKKVDYVYVHPKCVGYSLNFMSSDTVMSCK